MTNIEKAKRAIKKNKRKGVTPGLSDAVKALNEISSYSSPKTVPADSISISVSACSSVSASLSKEIDSSVAWDGYDVTSNYPFMSNK